jgi:hypothetical protein
MKVKAAQKKNSSGSGKKDPKLPKILTSPDQRRGTKKFNEFLTNSEIEQQNLYKRNKEISKNLQKLYGIRSNLKLNAELKKHPTKENFSSSLSIKELV